ncbi:Spy/CpxP family protein refolding chaperone [Ekhidna sp.]|uniref:Spy/CpxP family protein refolding chaperone n=1 Tax=Ekhidna sp. TaxID=2608089 RepID=UPI0032998E63
MKKLLTIMLISFALGAFSQSPEAMKKIEAAKIALITERLELTPQQAEKFWPIYREFGKQRQEIRQDFDKARRNFDPNKASEEENKKMLEMANQVKERQLKLERVYSDRILKVISTRQLNNLRKAENDFKEMLLRRIRAEQMKRQKQRRNDGRLNDRRN